MNSEQLNSARLARWSQNGEARLTQEAAAEWLGTIGFCPYLPMGLTGTAATASFLEAVVGRPAQTPSPGERSRALELLARLIENSSAVPLKLGSSLGEQPDFVASEEVLRYIYALRGDRNFKNGPSTVGNEKVTTLAQHCWQAIEQHGPMDVAAMQPVLGRDITEAAIARALQELWTGLYVFPILSAKGDAAKWELLSRRFPQQVAAGASTGQAESQSAMISLYLHAAVAAVEEDILTFLSPLASQSKLREVVRGLGSMRQLDIIDVAGRSHVCLQGGLLPEMVAQLSEEQLAAAPVRPEIEIEAAPQESSVRSRPNSSGEAQRPWRPRLQEDSDEPKRFSPKKFVPKQFVPRKFAAGSSSSEESAPKKFAIRASGARNGAGTGTGGYSRGRADERSGPRSGGRSSTGSTSRFGKSQGGETYPSQSSKPASPRSFAARGGKASGSDVAKPATRGLGERAKRWEKSGETAGDRSREDKNFTPRAGGFKSSGSSGYKSPSGPRPAGSKPWAAKGAGSRGASSRDGASKPWTPRASSSSGASSYGKRDSGERPKRWDKPGAGAAGRSAGSRPYAPKSSAFKSSGFKPGGFKSGSKPAGAKPWARRANSDANSSAGGARDAGERPKRWEGGSDSDARPAARKPSGYTASGFKSAGARSAESKPFGAKSAGSKPWASKGAASRVGSARSYAARSADGAAPRGGAKPYGKPAGAKPWTKRASADTDGGGERPKRRERSDVPAGEKTGAKPFWAKNPRGGKGSTASSRTNRPKAKGGKTKAGKNVGKKK